jgi:spore coat polysaccharide biosynthesis predicted glycosyltransferase SpsG
VALVADAGADAGLGHLSRSSAIAAALREAGCTVRCRAYGAQAPIERYGICWEPLPLSAPVAVDEPVVVLDSYHIDADQQAALVRDHRLLLFHDAGTVPDGALVIVARGRDACLGPDYWHVPRRRVRGEVRHVLVTTGGGRTGAELGGRLASTLRAALLHVEVALVRGPFAGVATPAGVRPVDGMESLAGELSSADLAVSSAGQTMLEAAVLGTPCVALVIAENQRRQAEEMAAAGAADVVDGEDAAVARAVALAADPSARRALAQRGQATIDGGGARRVAARIEELL